MDGFFKAGYADAYSAAWQALLPRATELAIPIVYLQRHALELIVKDLIGSCLAIRDTMDLGREVFGFPGPDALETESRTTDIAPRPISGSLRIMTSMSAN